LKVAVRLCDGGRIDTQFGGQLPHRWKGRGAPQCAGRDREAHALRDLHIERNRTARIDAVKHAVGSRSSVTVQYNSCPGLASVRPQTCPRCPIRGRAPSAKWSASSRKWPTRSATWMIDS